MLPFRAVSCLLLAVGCAVAADPDSALRSVRSFNFRSVRLAVEDLSATFANRYPKGAVFARRLRELERARTDVLAAWDRKAPDASAAVIRLAAELERLRYDALLGNPLLDFDKLMLVKRSWKTPGLDSPQGKRRPASPFYTNYGIGLGLPVNHTSLASVPPGGFDNEIAVLSPVRPDGKLTTFFRPRNGEYVGELDLHWEADRLLFTSAPGNRYRVFEIRADGSGLRQVTPDDQPDVDNFDATYLPDGRILFAGNASYQAVPCWNGLQTVACLYSIHANGWGMRQLTFDQDEDSYPTVLNTGQVLYCRWEYTNTPHVFPHLLFQMNPDGTGQREFFKSNSYWPNAVYFPRAIPGETTKVVGVVSGYHGDYRMGELYVLDPARGRDGKSAMVQKIPNTGEPVTPIRDRLTSASWPKFTHPWPLSSKYFIVSMKPSPEANFGIYLVDVWDNFLLLHESRDYALLEPTPLKATARPPVIAPKVDPARTDGTVYLHDVNFGPGLKGLPRGTVKQLRVIAYHFGYRGLSGWDKIGIDGPWEVMRILGTVPVEKDGSAMFRVPANTPVSVQPLDANGRALQVMRSWFTVMPGEVRSCTGCHDPQNTAPPVGRTIAATREPSAIAPFYGPARGFDFERDLQPVLDKYCVGCHGAAGRPDLRSTSHFPNYKGIVANVPKWWGEVDHQKYQAGLLRAQQRKPVPIRFTPAYEALHPYARRYGLEGDYVLSAAAEYHASTSELVQMLEKGHHGVKLSREAWDRMNAWIDLDVPCHGRWSDVYEIPFQGRQRRIELAKLYGGPRDDPEALPALPKIDTEPVKPVEEKTRTAAASVAGWPFPLDEARQRQRAAGWPMEKKVDLGGGLTLGLVLIPAGEYVMGSADGAPDERPPHVVTIAKPFWMAATEISNGQYALFDPKHDSRYINVLGFNTEERGFPVNGPKQPVVRVSYDRALEFCEWLSRKTGLAFRLPTEQQWEWAARAGTATPFYYGYAKTNFDQWANLADASIRGFYTEARYRQGGTDLRLSQQDWMLRVPDVDDRQMVSAPVGSYYPNAWGLYDMHGNAAEWTSSEYRDYASAAVLGEAGRMVVRGGSWHDRPQRATASFRWAYARWQGVYDVGIRVIAEAP